LGFHMDLRRSIVVRIPEVEMFEAAPVQEPIAFLR
jgi:hypothetical protein